MSTQARERARPYAGPQEGGIYILRHSESPDALHVPTYAERVRERRAQGSQKVQRWCLFREGSGWVFQELETGLFMGVDRRSLNAKVVTTTCATSWMIAVDSEEDTSAIRLVIPDAGYCITVDDDGPPRLDITDMRCHGKKQSWRLDGCGFLHMEDADDEAHTIGTTGLVSSLLCLPSA